jgi:hypothetical protein
MIPLAGERGEGAPPPLLLNSYARHINRRINRKGIMNLRKNLILASYVCTVEGRPLQKRHTFDSIAPIDRICQFVYKFVNRGWLNAVVWEYVLKIPGA